MVEVALIDGVVTPSRAADRSREIREVHGRLEGDDVDSRSHHVSCRRVAQIGVTLSDLAFLLGGYGRHPSAVVSASELHAGLIGLLTGQFWSRPRRGRVSHRELGRLVRLVGVRAAVEQRRNRSLEADRIERLDEETFGTALLREEDVGASVEQDQHRDRRQAATGLLELQVVADRDAAHVLHLAVSDHEIGRVVVGKTAHPGTGEHFEDLVLTVVDDAAQFVEHDASVAHEEDLCHRCHGNAAGSRW